MGKGRVGERSQSSQSPFFPNKCSAVSNFRPLGTNALLVPLVLCLKAGIFQGSKAGARASGLPAGTR